MATITHFLITDEYSKSTAKIYINSENRIFICVGGDVDDIMDSHFITLDDEDLTSLIKELQRLQNEIKNG